LLEVPDMIPSAHASSPRTQAVDYLFAAWGSPSPEVSATGAFVAAAAEVPAPGEPPPPPPLQGPEDLRAAQEWLWLERQRLAEYTRSSFAAILQQHQAKTAQLMHNEEAIVLRAQEVNRELRFLATQSAALQQRARELSEREQALAAQMARLAAAQQQFLAVQQSRETIERNIGDQCALLEKLRAETAQLQAAGAEAQARFASQEAELHQRQQTWEKKQAESAARQAQIENRYAALEQSEATMQRRLAELDDLEARLREEFEDQERQLTQERQEIALLRTRLLTYLRQREERWNGHGEACRIPGNRNSE
jgi:chromosome segregation ATPase